MADEKKETRSEELKDLDPKKDPKGGALDMDGQTKDEGRGEKPRFIG